MIVITHNSILTSSHPISRAIILISSHTSFTSCRDLSTNNLTDPHRIIIINHQWLSSSSSHHHHHNHQSNKTRKPENPRDAYFAKRISYEGERRDISTVLTCSVSARWHRGVIQTFSPSYPAPQLSTLYGVMSHFARSLCLSVCVHRGFFSLSVFVFFCLSPHSRSSSVVSLSYHITSNSQTHHITFTCFSLLADISYHITLSHIIWDESHETHTKHFLASDLTHHIATHTPSHTPHHNHTSHHITKHTRTHLTYRITSHTSQSQSHLSHLTYRITSPSQSQSHLSHHISHIIIPRLRAESNLSTSKPMRISAGDL